MRSKRISTGLRVALAIFIMNLLTASAWAATGKILYEFKNRGHSAYVWAIDNDGVVFELSPTAGGPWQETVLHSFNGGGDGSEPAGGLIIDSAGNLYGTTWAGGASGNGTVFEITP